MRVRATRGKSHQEEGSFEGALAPRESRVLKERKYFSNFASQTRARRERKLLLRAFCASPSLRESFSRERESSFVNIQKDRKCMKISRKAKEKKNRKKKNLFISLSNAPLVPSTEYSNAAPCLSKLFLCKNMADILM